MRVFRQLPEGLTLQALKSPLQIGPRQIVNFGDTAGQTIAAGATVVTAFNTSASVASSPAFGKTGTDIIVAADQAVLVEAVAFSLYTPDAAGKIKVLSCWMKSRANLLLPLNTQGNPVPYSFAASNNDYFTCVADLPNPYQEMREDADFTSNDHNFYTQFGVTLQNTDGTNSHSYGRNVVMQYRIVSNIDPINVLNLPLDDDE